MNTAQMPCMGDEITWGPVMHPNDPRQPEPCDDGDITSETLEMVREWLDDAENAHDAGNDEKPASACEKSSRRSRNSQAR